MERPVVTEQSPGEYQRDGMGKFTVFGTLSARWEIRHLGQHDTGAGRQDVFLLSGLASTSVAICDANAVGDQQKLAEWHVDIGDDASPGCHFHEQVVGGANDRHFPKGLDVPRFPSYFLTPMDVLDFLLGEIFQERWREHAFKNAGKSGWRRIQRRRLLKFFEWHYRVVLHASSSPWVALKNEKPRRDTLLGEACGWR